MKAAKEVKFKYAANLEYEIEENDPLPGMRKSFGYMRSILESAHNKTA